MELTNCRVPALLLFPALLAACGGGGTGGTPEPLSDAVVCGLRNCTESATLRTDEISTRFVVKPAADQASVKIQGFLGKSANLTTTVLMAPGERLSASVDGGAETPLSNPDGKRMDYTATLPASSVQPRVTLVFLRDGIRHVNEVVLPPPFSVVQPTGTPTVARSAGNLLVRLGPDSAGANASPGADGRCSRSDGSGFDVKDMLLSARNEPGTVGAYRISTLDLDLALNSASQGANNNNPNTPLVTRCDLTLTWLTASSGKTAATLNQYSVFSGNREATHTIVYDARL